MDRAKAAAAGVQRAPSAAGGQNRSPIPKSQSSLNLTIPKAHYAASPSGPGGRQERVELRSPSATPATIADVGLDAAFPRHDAHGVRVGCAPDTFLGAGIQTCRKLIDDGWIGEPIARDRLHDRATGMRAGTRTRSSTTRRAAGRCSTWGRTT